MIALFRNNLFVNSLLLLPYTILLRSHTLWQPEAYVPLESDTYIVKQFFGMFSHPLGQSIFAIVLIFLQAAAINRLNNKNRLSRQLTLLAGLGYIIMTSFLPEYLVLSPALLANTFIIWALTALFDIYKNPYTAIQLFNAGLAIGLALLFVPGLSVMILFGIISIITLKAFNLRDALQNIVGFGVVLYLIYSVLFLIDADITKDWELYLFSFQFELFGSIKSYLRVFLLVAVLIATTIIGYNGSMIKKTIEVQKKIDLLYWFLFLSFFTVLLSKELSFQLLVTMFVPASILVNTTFVRIKSHAAAEMLHLGAVAGLVGLHYFL